MNFKLNALVATLVMAASAPAFAAIQDELSGNGELLLNLRYYNGAGNAGGNDISALFDLGVTMDDFVAGAPLNLDLRAANYGTAFDDVLAFVDLQGGNRADIEFNVIALDSTNTDQAGGHRYITTTVGNGFPSLSNTGLSNWQNMDVYLKANQNRGTHATQVNGASTAVQADGSFINPVYFGSVGGQFGDTWRNSTTADTTAKIGVAQNLWLLTTSSLINTAQSTRLAVGGIDLNGDGLISATERGKISFAVDANGAPLGTLSYIAPVPEASTYGMMLAGLGLVGFMARRRLSRG